MMCFIDDEPVRPAGGGSHIKNRRQEVFEKAAAVRQVHRHGVDDEVETGCSEQSDDLSYRDWNAVVSDRDSVVEILIISFRIDNAELELLLDQAFSKQGGKTRLAAARTSGDQHRLMRLQIGFFAVPIDANQHAEPRRGQETCILPNDALNQLCDPGAMIARKPDVARLLDGGERIGDRC